MVRVFDWLTAECVRSFKAHDAPILAMAIDQTSTLLATASADSTVKVWDLHKGYCTHNFKGSMGIVTHVMFHHTDLQLFSCAADGYAKRAVNYMFVNLPERVCSLIAFASPHLPRARVGRGCGEANSPGSTAMRIQ